MKKLLILCVTSLAACAQVPPLEQLEPYQTITIDKPTRQVYESIMQQPYCRKLLHPTGEFNWDTRGFKVYFVTQIIQSGRTLDLITAEPSGENATLLKAYSYDKSHKPPSFTYVQRANTGACD